jgi:hypothetical protein
MTISPNKWELDVQGYLNVCNISAATPRQQIRDFAKGVNDLGLWNSMVCWPLRSSQNYGSGTTAFSLGGLGTYNGTLVNGPTWEADGVSFVTASNSRISTPTVPFSNSISVFNVFLHSAFGGTSGAYSATSSVEPSYVVSGMESFIAGESESRTLYVWIYNAGGIASNLTVPITNEAAFLNSFHAYGVSASATHNASLYDGTAATLTQSTPVVTDSPVAIGSQFTSGGRTITGKIPFHLVSATGFSASQYSSLYTLYKSTLGTGLGLP